MRKILEVLETDMEGRARGNLYLYTRDRGSRTFARSRYKAGPPDSSRVDCGTFVCIGSGADARVLSAVLGKTVAPTFLTGSTVFTEYYDEHEGLGENSSSKVCSEHDENCTSLSKSCVRE